MHEYPVFLSLEGKHCLVVGAGGVGRRKARSLLNAGAQEVLILDAAEPTDEVLELSRHANAVFEQRFFKDSDLDGRFLVFACTSSAGVNEHIARQCHERAILCNIADRPDMADFIVPASFRRGDLTVAVSTGGGSPAMSRKLRKDLEDFFGDEYAMLLKVMARVRPLLLSLEMETAKNTAIFRKLTNSGLLEAMKSRDLDKAGEILEEVLPATLRDNIPELLDGLV